MCTCVERVDLSVNVHACGCVSVNVDECMDVCISVCE